ncbi:AAA-domain-containing protein [Mycena kentingensis (nom. inval.)]|nr:AAA-domain-containing protein [Mycena kentingensis (nom. inval.)]
MSSTDATPPPADDSIAQAQTGDIVVEPSLSASTTASPLPSLPPSLLEKCFWEYSSETPPALDGVPIVLADRPEEPNPQPRILLAPSLIARAASTISNAFSVPIATSELTERTLPITALCSPHRNSLAVLDAAVRHVAHRSGADVLVLDPEDLAAGRHGVYGHDLTEAFWELYNYHYVLKSESDTDSSDSEAEDADAKKKDAQKQSLKETAQLRLAAAKAVVKSFLLAGLPATAGRKRIIYLRDYGALFKALSPLLSTLHEVLASAAGRIIILAGICPIDRTAPRNEQGLFSRIGESLSDLHEHLHARCNAQWRELSNDQGRYTSLEHIFTTMFVNRYHKTRGIARRSRSDDSFLQREELVKLKFASILRVGVVRGGLPAAVSEMEAARRKRRSLFANLWAVSAGAVQGIPDALRAVAHGESYKIEGVDSKTPSKFETSTMDKAYLKLFGSTLQPSAQVADILKAFALFDEADNEWTKVLKAAEDKPDEDTKDKTEKPKAVDPILERVREDDSLGKYEKRLLTSVIDPTKMTTTFADVCMRPEVIDTLRTGVILPMRFPEAFKTGVLAKESMGGVLLFGPPGTGKTMVCRALAKECGARMIHLQASTIQRCYVGETEQLIAAAFSLARRLGPCVVFVDEIDSLFSKRDSSSKPWHRTMVTEFCEQLDGLETASANRDAGLIVIGATNRPQDIDAAVLRRLSRRLLVDLPSSEQRKAIISKYLEGEPRSESVDLDDLASRTKNFSGSDLRYLVHSAALAAFKETLPPSFQETSSKKTEALPDRLVQGKHFEQALAQVSAISTTNQRDLAELRKWSRDLFR